MKKSYLGDGVYADWDGQRVVLTTENGIETTNKIFLEPEIIFALERYLERLEQASNKNNQPKTAQ